MNMDFADKKVLITGANRGIGFGLAEGFLNANADVTIVALEEDVTEVADQLSNTYGRRIRGIVCDIALLGQVNQMQGEVDRVDVLINNAGLEYATPVTDPSDHVDEVFRRASAIDPKISIATIYRTVRLFEEAGIIEKHDFGGNSARYEEATDDHHDHLVNIKNGNVIEFQNEQIEALQHIIAKQNGLKLVGHRLELYGVPLDDDKEGQ